MEDEAVVAGLELEAPVCNFEEGDNVVYAPCVVRLVIQSDTVEQRLFGAIIERHGRFKFVSLANRLD